MTTSTKPKPADAAPKTKTGSSRNRTAGHNFERDTVDALRHIFPKVATSRSCNQARDAEKIDIVNADELKHGRLSLNIQCKSVTGGVPYMKLLNEIPKEPNCMNVLFHRYTVKKGTRFFTAGEFAITSLPDFYQLQRLKKAYELLNEQFENLPEDIKETLIGQLDELGL